jgi:glycosyltransferase involved in cell wall biosynthesis
MTDELDPADAVVLAYVNSNQVTYSWHHSIVELIGHDLATRGRVLQGGYIAIRHGTDGLVEARNKAVQQFLDEREADWLFWIDTDMGFPADVLDRLVGAADPKTRPIVGGLCFTQRETGSDDIGGWHVAAAPTIFDWRTVGEKSGFSIRLDYPANAVVPCAGTGSACVLIHRSVFTAIAEKYGRSWYDRIPNRSIGELTSEDLSFCMRAASLGIPIHVHTGVRTSHQKTVWLGENDFLGQLVAPSAAERTAVIVPVLRRPDNAGPFMRSLRASTALAEAYAVADPDDTATAQAWADAGATVLFTDRGDDRPGTFAEKANIGAAKTSEPWLFLVGDDVRFHPGWLDHAQAAGAAGAQVVGTNDMGNPRVLAGEHATHLLIRRTYIEQMGASWDGPGVVAHEGYRHWYVDDEIVTAARARGVWRMALGSRVEHLHPAWGKGEADDVYRLGAESAATDKALFEQRSAVNL